MATYHVVTNKGSGDAYRGNKKQAVETYRKLAKQGKRPVIVTPNGDILSSIRGMNKPNRSTDRKSGSSGGSGG